jgi:hypothetical protein
MTTPFKDAPIDNNCHHGLLAYDYTANRTVALGADAASGALLTEGTVTVSNAVTVSGTVSVGNAVTVNGTVTANPTTWAPYSNSAVTAATAIKIAPGSLLYLDVWNPNASMAYLQVFDATVAHVALGATVPTYIFPIPPVGGWSDALNFHHANAITIAATTTPTGAVTMTLGLNVTAGFV